jgi:hypothetical protein
MNLALIYENGRRRVDRLQWWRHLPPNKRQKKSTGRTMTMTLHQKHRLLVCPCLSSKAPNMSHSSVDPASLGYIL